MIKIQGSVVQKVSSFITSLVKFSFRICCKTLIIISFNQQLGKDCTSYKLIKYCTASMIIKKFQFDLKIAVKLWLAWSPFEQLDYIVNTVMLWKS